MLKLLALVGSWLDVAPVDANRRRTEEPQPLRRLRVGDVYERDLGIDTKVVRHSPDELARRFVVRASLEEENFHLRPLHATHRRVRRAFSRLRFSFLLRRSAPWRYLREL